MFSRFSLIFSLCLVSEKSDSLLFAFVLRNFGFYCLIDGIGYENFGFFLVFSKTALKLSASRIKLLKNKKDAQVKQLKRDVAQLLESGQERTAMIRVCYSRSLLFLLVFLSFHLGFDHFLIILLWLLWFYLSLFGSFGLSTIGMDIVVINNMESIIKLFSSCAYSSTVFKIHWMGV